MKTFNITVKINLSNPIPMLEDIKEYIQAFMAVSEVKYEEVKEIDTFTLEECEELRKIE